MQREALFIGAAITAAASVFFGLQSAQNRAMAQADAVGPALTGIPEAEFANWEIPHVSPLAMTPNGQRLLAVNTADHRLEIFDVNSGSPVLIGSAPVGLAPVSVRALDNRFALVANHVSDTISVVNLHRAMTVQTIDTADEPCDMVIAGDPERLFVSCAQANVVQVFDFASDIRLNPSPAAEVALQAEDPRMLAVSPDGLTVYAAIFEGGNRTTILGGGSGLTDLPVMSPLGPYGGLNPPPNDGAGFIPAVNPLNPPAPAVGLIVKNIDGQWMDDNGGDWTDLVSGPNAPISGRLEGWNLLDHDLALIDTATLTPEYRGDLMTTSMALAVNPVNGIVSVVGTDAFNHIRFEPNLNSRFISVDLAMVDPPTDGPPVIRDLNPHLAGIYPTETSKDPNFVALPVTERDKSIGDPRGIAWSADGARAYVTGMGSNNLVVINTLGDRAGIGDTIEVGEGPTGVVVDDTNNRVYVLNKFEASVSVVDMSTETELSRVYYFDPTPDAIKIGRKHLYDTHKNSGTGHVSCASCHLDGRMDNLSWDLGAPNGDMKPFNQNCIDLTCQDWHPMKGPMTTQTLVDIIGQEPHHWRGDREGIEAFNGAFEAILGGPLLTAGEMQEFEDFLSTVIFAPNPFRNLDNSLPTDLALDGHFTTGRFAPPGQPMPNGNAETGLILYQFAALDGVQCVTCHTLPTGMGPNGFFDGNTFVELPPGPMGELHLGIIAGDGSSQRHFKTPHLRNMHEKTGFNTTLLDNTAGFGYLHDGTIDSIERFIGDTVFTFQNLQGVSDMVAFMLAFGGSDLPDGSPTNPLEPPGTPSKDTHAGVGTQVTVSGPLTDSQVGLLLELVAIADAGDLGLIAEGVVGGQRRMYNYVAPLIFQADASGEFIDAAILLATVPANEAVTVTAVVPSTAERLSIDRDNDGFLNFDEVQSCADPGDPFSTPDNSSCCPADITTTGATLAGQFGFGVPDGVGDIDDLGYFLGAWLAMDLAVADVTSTGATLAGQTGFGEADQVVDLDDLGYFITLWLAGCP
ncbi:MAG: YncE family protein [Planctomycetota bacterium]